MGGIAQAKHIPAIMRLVAMWEPVDLVAVADVDERMAEKVGKQYHVPWYRDYKDMLNKEEIEGVEIIAPDELHAEQTIVCL